MEHEYGYETYSFKQTDCIIEHQKGVRVIDVKVGAGYDVKEEPW